MTSLLKTLQEFNNYLGVNTQTKTKAKTLKKFMDKQYGENWTTYRSDFHLTVLGSSENAKEAVIKELTKLLSFLQIDPMHWSQYLQSELTVYDFFKKLRGDLKTRKESTLQLEYLLACMDEQKFKEKLVLAAPMLLFVLTLCCSAAVSGEVGVAMGILRSFLHCHEGPLLLNMVKDFSTTLYNLHESYSDSNDQKFLSWVGNNAFSLLAGTSRLSARGILMATGAANIPIAVPLLAAASLLDLFQVIFLAEKKREAYMNHPFYKLQQQDPNFFKTADPSQLRHYAGLKVDYLKQYEVTKIKFLYSVILISAVLTLPIAPAGFAFAAIVSSLILLACGLQQMALNHNETQMFTQLDQELEALGLLEEPPFLLTQFSMFQHETPIESEKASGEDELPSAQK